MNLLKRLFNRKPAKVYTLDDIKIDESLSEQWVHFSDHYKLRIDILNTPYGADRRINVVVKLSLHNLRGFVWGEWYSLVDCDPDKIHPYGLTDAWWISITFKTVIQMDFNLQETINSMAWLYLNQKQL